MQSFFRTGWFGEARLEAANTDQAKWFGNDLVESLTPKIDSVRLVYATLPDRSY